MNIIFTEWDRALVYLAILIVIFLFSFFSWIIIFRELDYYEVKYTKKNKTKDIMVNILQSRFCNTLVAYLTTIAFTTVILTPPSLMADINLDLNAINFGMLG